MKTVDHFFIFDVDGVITNPQEKKITEPEILDHIVQRLESGEPVALNTGRSLVWIIEKVITPLFEKVNNKKSLQNLFASGEKGGTWITYNENGQIEHHKNHSISVPLSLQEKVRNIIDSEFSGSMFYDESKETMISTEMKDGHLIDDYAKKQETFASALTDLLVEEKLDNNFKIDRTTIAVDIENKFVGKHFAVKRILEWIKRKGFKPQRYIAFGDSFESDIPMAHEIHKQGLPVEFVYVGKESINLSNSPFPVISTNAPFGKGTLEFLQSL